MKAHLNKVAVTVLGWVLLLAGLAALVLPGPGLLLLASGLVVLSREYDWARRRLEPVEAKAWLVAREGVQTVPRIIFSAAGALALIAIGLIWGWSPTIPRWWIFGPQLPFAGWGVATTLVLSGLVAAALLVYSVRRFRAAGAQSRPQPAPVQERARAAQSRRDPRH